MKRALVLVLLAGCAARTPAPPPEPAPPRVQVPEPEPEIEASEPPVREVSAPPSRVDEDGLVIETLSSGSGARAVPGTRVAVHYVGTLEDGTVFDSSRERGTPFEFELGRHHVIEGFERCVDGMQVGEIRRATIPPELGYKDRARGKIPANATLIFEIELLGVE